MISFLAWLIEHSTLIGWAGIAAAVGGLLTPRFNRSAFYSTEVESWLAVWLGVSTAVIAYAVGALDSLPGLAGAAALLAVWVTGAAEIGASRRSPAKADEFKVKRESVFEFARKPTVTREGDRVTISFASRGACDATVAIEDSQDRIIRHLACGVLGKKAPPPFQRASTTIPSRSSCE